MALQFGLKWSIDVVPFLKDVISQYGYMAIFLCLTLGIVGLPIPDEILMTFIGYLASEGLLHLPLSILVCCAGTLTGMLISYLLGRHFGKPLLWKYGKWIRLTPKRLTTVERWFSRFGPWAVSVGYFIPGLRHLTCYFAGVSAMGLRKYFAFAGLGALVWCVFFISIGYYFGTAIDLSS